MLLFGNGGLGVRRLVVVEVLLLLLLLGLFDRRTGRAVHCGRIGRHLREAVVYSSGVVQAEIDSIVVPAAHAEIRVDVTEVEVVAIVCSDCFED
jgi:hypothetical protein